MITRLYANNFRCLVAFEAKFEPFTVLCGPNGAGKSSVFDALKIIRDLAGGSTVLGGEGPQDVSQLEHTSWLDSKLQEFELGINADGHSFEYLIHLEQVASELKPRIVKERATCDGRELFARNLEGVSFQKAIGTKTGFPLDWRQAALGSIQAAGDRREILTLQEALAKLLILRPNPLSLAVDSKNEAPTPSLHMENLLSWYRFLSQEQDFTDALRESLQDVWPDFRSFKLIDAGRNAKALQLRFEGSPGGDATVLYFDQISDGEKALVGLYMIRAALSVNALQTVLIDEPGNYVGLPELQPWMLSIRELLDRDHQAILISHNQEIVDEAGEAAGQYLWRDNHASPTRIAPLSVPDGLRAAEAVARGWVRG